MMQRNPWQRAYPQRVYPQLLSKWWQDIKRSVNIPPAPDVPEPIRYVDDDIIRVRGNSFNARTGLWGLYLTLICLTGFSFHITYPNSIQNVESHARKWVDAAKEKYGDDFFETTTSPTHLKIYRRVGHDGKMSLSEYINYRIEREGAIVFFLKPLIFITLLYLSLRMTPIIFTLPRFTDFYFDRNRQIIYLWRNNTVVGCYFDNVGVYEDWLGLHLSMYGEDVKDKSRYVIWGDYTAPHELAVFRAGQGNREVLAYIIAFMEQGKTAIFTGDTFYRPKARFFWSDIPKPDNFEARLEEVLKRQHVLPELYAERANNSLQIR